MERNTQEKIVRVLSSENVDVRNFSEDVIAGYVQTKQTIDRINSYLVSPFEMAVKSSEIDELFSSDNLFLGTTSRNKNIKYSAKEVLTLTENLVRGNSLQNGDGIRLDGVKRFGNHLGVDAGYLSSLMSEWQNQVLGTRQEVGISSSCDDLEEIVLVHSPRLIMLDDFVDFDVNSLSEDDVKLYLAGAEHVKNLKSLIINPFENAFKTDLDVEIGETKRDVKHYGGLSVLVNCVSRDEPDYKKSVGLVEGELLKIAGMTSVDSVGGELFWNADRKVPIMYVNSSNLLSKIEEYKSQKFPKMKREVSVLYRPVDAHIL